MIQSVHDHFGLGAKSSSSLEVSSSCLYLGKNSSVRIPLAFKSHSVLYRLSVQKECDPQISRITLPEDYFCT